MEDVEEEVKITLADGSSTDPKSFRDAAETVVFMTFYNATINYATLQLLIYQCYGGVNFVVVCCVCFLAKKIRKKGVHL